MIAAAAAQKGIGRLAQIGVAKESTRGTAASSASFWNPWIDLTLDEKKEFAVDEQSYGIIEDNVNLSQVKKWAQGSIQGNVHDQSIGLLLYALFGGYAVAGPTDSAYTHTFTIGQSAQHQSLTFFLHDPLSAQDYKYANGVVEKMDIDIALKKFVAFNASIKALSGATASAFSPSTTTENRFLTWRHGGGRGDADFHDTARSHRCGGRGRARSACGGTAIKSLGLTTAHTIRKI